MNHLLNSTIDTKIQIRLDAGLPSIQRRFPPPWRVAPVTEGLHRGTNLLVIFNEVLLKQQADGSPAPDAVNRFVGFLAPATHPETGEAATFMLRIYAAHPDSVPGRYGNALRAAVWREQSASGGGLETVCQERFELRPEGGGRVELRVRYRRGLPARMAWPTTMRSAADASTARLYRSEALLDVVRSVPAGIDRLEDFHLQVDVPEFADLFDGAEGLVSVTILPWFVRQEFEAGS